MSSLQDFLAFSARITGFTAFRLQGTGQAEAYRSTVVRIVGEAAVDELISRFGKAREEAGEDGDALDKLLRARIFSDDKLGPVARNIIKLWYVGTWYQLPEAWRDAFGAKEGDTTFVVSADAYTEGLLWPAAGTNPPGAKGLGYGTWAEPPRIPGLSSLGKVTSK